MCCGALTRSSRLLRRCRPLALPRRRPAAPPALAPPPSAAAPPSHAPPQPARVQSAVCILCLWVWRTPHCGPAADCGTLCASHMRVRATLHSPWLGKPAAPRPSCCTPAGRPASRLRWPAALAWSPGPGPPACAPALTAAAPGWREEGGRERQGWGGKQMRCRGGGQLRGGRQCMRRWRDSACGTVHSQPICGWSNRPAATQASASPVHLLQHGRRVRGRRVAAALAAATGQLLQRPVGVPLVVRRPLLRLFQGAQLPSQLL